MSEIHESGEDYLEAILCIKKLNGAARSVDVSKRLGVSKPSVSRAIGILIENEYIYIGETGALCFTEKGKEKAEEIFARHTLLTDFLVKITGVSKEQAEKNACKIEHDIDDDVKKGIERWMENNKDA